jgi:hypothetical protein
LLQEERKGIKMFNVSLSRVLGVWDELHLALRGENGFGGDTAEIYAYRLSDRDPMYHEKNGDYDSLFGDDFRETDESAKFNLLFICNEFMKHHDCSICIDTHEGWMDWDGFNESDFISNHRYHVKVVKNEDTKRRLQ